MLSQTICWFHKIWIWSHKFLFRLYISLEINEGSLLRIISSKIIVKISLNPRRPDVFSELCIHFSSRKYFNMINMKWLWQGQGHSNKQNQHEFKLFHTFSVQHIWRWKIVTNVSLSLLDNFFKMAKHFSLHQCTIAIGVHPPKNCSSLKNHFSAPYHSTDMTFFVYDPNTSKNKWTFFQVFSLLKIGRKSIKT